MLILHSDCRSQDYTSLLYAFEQLFDIVTATKPSASRNTSAEIFVVCRGYKAPAKIDPALLDPRHLFKVCTHFEICLCSRSWYAEVSNMPRVVGPLNLSRILKYHSGWQGVGSGSSSLPAMRACMHVC